MAAAAPAADHPEAPHVPVLIDALIAAVAPVEGHWIDGTFGAGGYTRRLLEAGAEHVTAIDRDPTALAAAADWAAAEPGLTLVEGRFGEMERLVEGPVQGVALDLGVSSMQLDQAERGFSFTHHGPLDMRMSGQGPTAADLVNGASEGRLADILFHYGEERAARRIARALVAARPVETTERLAEVVVSCLPRPKPGQSHPATRSFQALRIAVNDEFGELIRGLEAAERLLAAGGALAVVTFHSLEDRVVKRFLHVRSSEGGGGSRHAPVVTAPAPTLRLAPRKAIAPTAAEVAANPRARSAHLRVARRTEAPATPVDRAALGLPGPADWWAA
ncbi:MAG: 16S rRNA (cytosine(1402)-N(4))-methyltransferase RsmH [Paracoccaceae bacterium]|jgi:16S rRNA (cytosine1402-N4)-methyltransferase|nr:16S rRNA (cytosine(1402)-N(4))-methyltransferase RsmH [Paracoccaceae bacterium]